MDEQKRFDMDPTKKYNQDWREQKVNEGEDTDEFKSYYQTIEQYKEIRNGLEYKVVKDGKRTIRHAINTTGLAVMIEIIVNDRMGRKERVKCMPSDTIGDFKKLVSAHIGTRPEKIRLQKGNRVFKDHITLDDYEIHHGSAIDMYYN